MIPRHVRIKKLPAKHKQLQVSEGGGAGGRGGGRQGSGAAGRRGGGSEGRGSAERSCPWRQAHSELGRPQSTGPWSRRRGGVAKRVDSSHPSAQARPGVSEPQRLWGGTRAHPSGPLQGSQDISQGLGRGRSWGGGACCLGSCRGPPGGEGPQDFPGARLGVSELSRSCPGAVPAWAGAKPEAKAAMGKVSGPAPRTGLPLPLAQGSLDFRHRAH